MTWRPFQLACAFLAGMVVHAWGWNQLAIEADGVKLKCVEPGSIIAGNALVFILGISIGARQRWSSGGVDEIEA